MAPAAELFLTGGRFKSLWFSRAQGSSISCLSNVRGLGVVLYNGVVLCWSSFL